MSYRRIHFLVSAHGSLTSLAAIDYACGLAHSMGAALDVTLPQFDVKVPQNWFAGRIMAGIAWDIEATISAKRTEHEMQLKQRCEAAGVGFTISAVTVDWPGGASSLASFGRTSDLCLLGLTRSPVADIAEVEPWLFSTGRPCLLSPDNRTEAVSLDTAAIAWDMSRSAARAVADALPLLKRAKSVHVLVGRGEKGIASSQPAAPLVAYLAAHGIGAAVDEFDVSEQKIGDALVWRAASHNADLLVMGAFGHSRLREFVLGGATRRVLDTTPIPLLMSH
ncbi:MAG: universal stress protein [Hyphomonas sp.]|uniref:universal stress protein n=1 Tax=Hyphomonas sp. TaxID=87 RepID=UPI0034A02F6E